MASRRVLIIPKGRNFFHLKDAGTGKVVGFSTSSVLAHVRAGELERGGA
ncbi:hypothetical protein [Pseudomonas sp. PDM13]|nr:hypothetical protein [Pseudomonas sp. PDM13]MCU9947539.1 hypothetical protein [Pseudomonas sp. PDM13]